MIINPHPRPDQVHFIIGAMKAGTTALYNGLASHPAICACDEKEPGVFAQKHITSGTIDAYILRWTDWDPKTHHVALDASTHYTKAPVYPDAAGKIHAFNPKARLVYLVRNPYDRIRSQYQMSIVKGWSITPLSDKVDYHALTISMYHYQLSLFRQFFNKDQILVLTTQQLEQQPDETFKRVLQHLGLDDLVNLVPQKSHESERLYLLPYIRATLKVAGNDISEAPAAELTEFINNMPSARRNDLLVAAAKLYTLTPANKAEIHQALRDDMRRLQDEYEIDVGVWGF